MRGREVERPKIDGGSDESSGSGTGWDELNLAELEAEAFLLGQWRNFEELEENLCLEELNAILNAAREQRYEQNKFLAALKGIRMDEDDAKTRFEEAKRKAEGVLAGKSGLEADVHGLGFGVETEEEE